MKETRGCWWWSSKVKGPQAPVRCLLYFLLSSCDARHSPGMEGGTKAHIHARLRSRLLLPARWWRTSGLASEDQGVMLIQIFLMQLARAVRSRANVDTAMSGEPLESQSGTNDNADACPLDTALSKTTATRSRIHRR